jgi:hypothetical protein
VSRLDGDRLTLMDLIECYKLARRMYVRRRDAVT